MPRFLSVLALALMLSIVVAPVASAQDGVQVDPDSPPAVEYALPLQDARGDAAGSAREGTAGAGSEGGGGAAAPAFGSGITRKPARSGSSAGERQAGSEDGSDSASGSAQSSPPPAGSPDARAGDVGSRATLYSLGGAAAILLAGGLVGFALRRRQSSA